MVTHELVTKLPGCFASGHTLDELWASIQESIELYLTDDDKASRNVPIGVPRLDEFQVHL